MELRAELTPIPVGSARKIAIRKRIRAIEATFEGGQDPTVLINEFNQFTGREFDEDMFRNYWRSINLDHFVRRASRPIPTVVPNVTQAELVEIVRRAMPQNGDPEHEAYAEIFDANVPMPCASGMIYWPPGYDSETNTWGDGKQMGEYDPTPAQIVEWAMSHSCQEGP
jgi:hypothetical protein